MSKAQIFYIVLLIALIVGWTLYIRWRVRARWTLSLFLGFVTATPFSILLFATFGKYFT